jgi:hypothetical protein
MAQSQDTDDDEVELPFVVEYSIAHHPAGIVIALTYAKTVERFENRELDLAIFGFDRELASRFAKVLQRETRPDRKPPARRKPH